LNLTMTTHIRFIVAAIFVITASYAGYLGYECGKIKANPENYGLAYHLPDDLTNGVSIVVDYNNHSGYKTGENPVGVFAHEFFGTKYDMSNVYIKVPIVASIYHFALSEPFVQRRKNSAWYKASDRIMQHKGLNGGLDLGRHAGNPFVMKEADNLLVASIAKKNHVNPVKMIRYAGMIPLMHELGHAYFKYENYNNFSFDPDDPLTSKLSEYTAEYISFVICYSMMLKDKGIGNKQGALDTLKVLYAAARFRSSGAHYGTSLVAFMIYSDFPTLMKDAISLGQSYNRSKVLSDIAYSILNMDKERLPKKIKGMFLDDKDMSNQRELQKELMNYVKDEIVDTMKVPL